MSLRLPTSLRSHVSSRKLAILGVIALLGVVVPAVPAASARKTVAHKHPRLHVLAHAFAAVALPGVRVRRLLFWRYLLIWQKPITPDS